MQRADLDLPRTLGRYELLVRLGSGGMAAVYLARVRASGGFEREVAVKLTHPHLCDDPELVASLLQEARIAARIRHPNVVPVLDVVEDTAGVFLVMEYVEGDALSAVARRERTAGGRVPLPVVLRALGDALAGLHAAHELRGDDGALLGVVHRDFSPQNVLLGVDGIARLTDFGVAKVAALSSSTRSGFIKGKLGYLSPEQVRSPRDVDRRADVWAAGVMAWELLAGRLLYPREDEAATLLRIVTEEPPRVRSVWPDVPPALDEAIAEALRMERDARTPTADELRRRLLDPAAHGVPLADASELAAYVERCTGDKLRERRRSLEGALAGRARGPRVVVRGERLAAAEAASVDRTRTELTATTAEATTIASRHGRRALAWSGLAAIAAIGVGGVFLAPTLLRRTAPSMPGAPAGASIGAGQPSAAAESLPPAGDGDRPAAARPSSSTAIGPGASGATGPVAAPRPPVPSRRASPHRASRPVHPPASTTAASARPALPSDPLDDAR